MRNGKLGGIAGTFTAAITIAAVEWLGHRLFPLPQPIAVTDRATAAAALRAAPTEALAVVVLAWIIGAFIGGFVARRLGGPGWPALAVAAFVLIGIVLNVLQLPHPAWMIALGALGVAAAGWLTSRLRLGERP